MCILFSNEKVYSFTFLCFYLFFFVVGVQLMWATRAVWLSSSLQPAQSCISEYLDTCELLALFVVSNNVTLLQTIKTTNIYMYMQYMHAYVQQLHMYAARSVRHSVFVYVSQRFDMPDHSHLRLRMIIFCCCVLNGFHKFQYTVVV